MADRKQSDADALQGKREQNELNAQGDYISGAVGDDGKDVVVGKNIDTRRTQQDQRNTQRSDPSQNLYLNSGNDDRLQGVYVEINRHAQQIAQHAWQINDMLDRWRELNTKLDNTPEKVDILTGRTDRQDARIQNLENRALEVVVRPGPSPEIFVRPVTPPVAPDLSNRTLFLIMIIIGALLLVAFGFLVWWLVSHAK